MRANAVVLKGQIKLEQMPQCEVSLFDPLMAFHIRVEDRTLAVYLHPTNGSSAYLLVRWYRAE